jgi:uncharacterized protein (TIGR00266 family)
MEFEILYQPSYALAKIALRGGESIVAESGAMVAMSDNVEIQTEARGGLFGGLKRSMLGGESFFQNTFVAQNGPGEVMFAPALPGDIAHLRLNGETVFVQSGSYMASSPDIEVDTKWSGAKGFFSKEGLFLLRASGMGDLFLSSYGGIHEITLNPGQSYTIDTGHMVAFDSTIDYNVRKVGGLKSTLFSGEGLVASYSGTGRLFMQTRSEDAFLGWLAPKVSNK